MPKQFQKECFLAGKIRKQKMDTLLQYFQSELEADFGYDDDTAIDQLQVAMEELKKAKMDLPPPPTNNELPKLPFGLEIQPSVHELIAKRPDETFDEHFRKNIKGGKAAFYRKRGLHATTPEMGGRGPDTRSLQSSRMSEYSGGDLSSYYDTAANSRLSIVDFSTKTSPKSSRTSLAEGSDVGSLNHLDSRHTPVALDEEEMDIDRELQKIEDDEQGKMNLDQTLTRDATLENLMATGSENGEKPPSQASEYDNVNGIENHESTSPDFRYEYIESPVELKVEHIKQIPVQYEIPVQHEVTVQHAHRVPTSRSDGSIDGRVSPAVENVWVERHENVVVEEKPSMDISPNRSPGVQNQGQFSQTFANNEHANTFRQAMASHNSRKRTSPSQGAVGHGQRTPGQAGSHSSPNTPTYMENGGNMISPKRFVSQFQIRHSPGVHLDHPNGYNMQMEYTEQTNQVARGSTSQREIIVHHL